MTVGQDRFLDLLLAVSVGIGLTPRMMTVICFDCLGRLDQLDLD